MRARLRLAPAAECGACTRGFNQLAPAQSSDIQDFTVPHWHMKPDKVVQFRCFRRDSSQRKVVTHETQHTRIIGLGQAVVLP